MTPQGFFNRLGKQPSPFGEKIHGIFAEGEDKLDVNSISGEKCMILKKFSSRKQPYAGPYYRR
jgi:hypothetical protein